jgi:hypothetical protein
MFNSPHRFLHKPIDDYFSQRWFGSRQNKVTPKSVLSLPVWMCGHVRSCPRGDFCMSLVILTYGWTLQNTRVRSKLGFFVEETTVCKTFWVSFHILWSSVIPCSDAFPLCCWITDWDLLSVAYSLWYSLLHSSVGNQISFCERKPMAKAE